MGARLPRRVRRVGNAALRARDLRRGHRADARRGTGGSADGTAIRDALPKIGGPPGRRFPASSSGVAAALDAIRGGVEIDLDGEATNLDWDANGDVTGGLMSIWRFADGGIEELRTIPVDLSR